MTERPGAVLQRKLDAERAECNARADVVEVRERIAVSGVQLRSLTDGVLIARVVDHVGDVETAAQAIVMEPRPNWLRDLIGADLMRVHPRWPEPCDCTICRRGVPGTGRHSAQKQGPHA